jgi:hypothetical protein|tara:strand:+ start:192 stop:386 length:195 start_codon:yes stop_codon:yes gene_type:complete
MEVTNLEHNGDTFSVVVDDDLYLRVKLGLTQKYLTQEQLDIVDKKTGRMVQKLLKIIEKEENGE